MSATLILGTAGHIDHGKTALVRALTGVETDRLPEEQRRGMTIELGFAHAAVGEYQFGVVDVPGHERFVRHMLAGATGMDVALLVVACDDGIKPQTREHLDILRLLRVPTGVIALTKCDLVDRDWLDLIRDEVRQLVAGTFLESAECLPVSSKTGEGLPALRQALLRAAERAVRQRDPKQEALPFRLPIDRVFALEGHGTIVTGTVYSGLLCAGDEVEIQPGGRLTRARMIQSHGGNVTQVARGQRAAINLAGIHHLEIRRGQQLAAPGLLVPSRLMTCHFNLVASASRSLKDRTRVKVHLGTAEVTAVIRMMRSDRTLDPGQTAFVQCYLVEPAVAVWGQTFVARRESPAETLGGGQIVNPQAMPHRRGDVADEDLLQGLIASNPGQRLAAAIFFAAEFSGSAGEWVRLAGLAPDDALLQQLVDAGTVIRLDGRGDRPQWVHARRIAMLEERLLQWLSKHHALHPKQRGVPFQQVLQAFARRGVHSELLQRAITPLQQRGQLESFGDRLAIAGVGPRLTRAEQELLEQLERRLRESGLAAPTVKELQSAFSKQSAAVLPLLRLLVDLGTAVSLTAELFLHAETMTDIRATLDKAFAAKPRLTLAEMRDALQTTRKYIVPLAEYLDEVGYTKRVGDERCRASD